jgi:transcription antitermination factor NusG
MATASINAVSFAMTPAVTVKEMELAEQRHWYALRTRSRHEKMVNEQLENQGLESFLPLVKRMQKWSDRKKEVEWPVFSGYSFVRMDFSSPERLKVLKTYGVVGFVGVRSVGVPIPDNQIADIRTLLASGVPFEERMFLRVGQRVRIRSGALAGVEGILSSYDKQQSLVISVDLIRRSLSVRLQGYAVEPV